MSEAVWATLPAPVRNRSWTSPEHAKDLEQPSR